MTETTAALEVRPGDVVRCIKGGMFTGLTEGGEYKVFESLGQAVVRTHGGYCTPANDRKVFERVETTHLKPCPFCGADVMPRHALWASDGDVDSIIHAAPSPECGLGDFTIYSADDGKSVAVAWNRRAA